MLQQVRDVDMTASWEQDKSSHMERCFRSLRGPQKEAHDSSFALAIQYPIDGAINVKINKWHFYCSVRTRAFLNSSKCPLIMIKRLMNESFWRDHGSPWNMYKLPDAQIMNTALHHSTYLEEEFRAERFFWNDLCALQPGIPFHCFGKWAINFHNLSQVGLRVLLDIFEFSTTQCFKWSSAWTNEFSWSSHISKALDRVINLSWSF